MNTAKPGFIARLRRALARLGMLALFLAAGVLAAKYWLFERLDEGIRNRVEMELRSHYPGLDVRVKSARRVEGKGIEIRGIVIAKGRSAGSQTLVQVSEVLAECDTGFPNFISDPLHFRRLIVRGMKLRAERGANGSWNLASLLPLPQHDGPCPAAVITDGSIEIVDPQAQGGGTFTLRNIELSVTPQAAAKSSPKPAQYSKAMGNSKKTAIARGVPHESTLLRIEGTLGGDHLEKIQVDALLDPVTGTWDLRGAVEGLEFNPRLRAALPHELGNVLRPLASVRGRTHFGFHVIREPIRDAAGTPPHLQFAIDGQIAEGRVDDARLPDPLTDVIASIHCDQQSIRIDDLSARCGQTIVENLSAELRGYASDSPVSMHLVVRNLDLDRLPRSSLPADAREAWAKFSPRGRINVEGDLSFDGRQWHPNLTANCLDLSLLYDKFPYRIGDGRGTIRFAQNRLTANLQLLGGGQLLHLTADILNPGTDYAGWVQMKSVGPLALNDQLIAALDDKSEAVVRSFHPRGNVSFAGGVQRTLDRGLSPPALVEHRSLTLQLLNCTVQHDKFSYPIDNVTGTLQYSDGDWTFSDLAGKNDSASIVGSGYWLAKAADGNQLALTFSATNVALEEELRLALSLNVQSLWTNVRPSGTVDQVNVRMKYNPALSRFGIEIDAHKASPTQSGNVSIEPAWFRYRLEDLTGDFYYRDGIVKLTNVEAIHGKTKVAAEGTCQARSDGSASMRLTKLTADHIEIDQDLVAALPKSLGNALARLKPSGHINMYGGLGVAVPQHANGPNLDWNLTFVLDDGRLEAGLTVEHIGGEINFAGQSDSHIVQCRGELDITSAIIHDVQVTNIKGPLWVDTEQLLAGMWAERNVQGRTPRFITATIFGEGELSLDGQLKFTPAGDFLVQASVENADLTAIVADLAPQARGVTGKVYGAINLGGTTEGMHTWRGDGQLRLMDAYLYELPAMVSLLQVLSIQRPDRNAFTRSNMDFKIEGDDLEFTHLDLNGEVISLKGKGRVTGGRELDLKFYTQLGRDELQLNIFRPLVGDMNRQFLLVEVTGPIDHPISRKTAFPRLNENLQQLFPELARAERREEPPRSKLAAPREYLERRGLWPKRE